MLPIRDINPRVRVPYLNYTLIGVCGLVFLLQLALGKDGAELVTSYGFVPSHLSQSLSVGEPILILTALGPIVSSMFMHGGWFHVTINLLYLRVFGDNVEDHLGHVAFFFFYMMAGLAGGLAQYVYDPQSSQPVIGASGAVAGVLGAYIVMFPRAKILTLFPIFVVLTFLEVPAVVFMGMWVLMQFLIGYLSIVENIHPLGDAWYAHLGGFAAGLGAGAIYRLRRKMKSSEASAA